MEVYLFKKNQMCKPFFVSYSMKQRPTYWSSKPPMLSYQTVNQERLNQSTNQKINILSDQSINQSTKQPTSCFSGLISSSIFSTLFWHFCVCDLDLFSFLAGGGAVSISSSPAVSKLSPSNTLSVVRTLVSFRR